MTVVSRTQYYTATSLDGFIADESHSLDWLFTRQRDPDGLLSYAAFIAEVGAIAMGSTTYEWILEHEFAGRTRPSGSGWYQVPGLGVHAPGACGRPGAPISFAHGDVVEVHAAMVEAAGGRNVWIVGGGDLVGQFADAGLLDEVLVTIAPVTLGAGAPLLPRRLELRLEEVGETATSPAPGTASPGRRPDRTGSRSAGGRPILGA